MNHFEMALLGTIIAYTGLLMWTIKIASRRGKQLEEAYGEIRLLDKFNFKFQEMLASERVINEELRRRLSKLTTEKTAELISRKEPDKASQPPLRGAAGGWMSNAQQPFCPTGYYDTSRRSQDFTQASKKEDDGAH